LKIETLAVDRLIPYARNSRTHSDEQVAQIAASIREFGFTNPVLIDGKDGIIAGHGRVLGARKLGMESVPCVRLEHLTEAQKRAYIIADNKLALNAGWDESMLALEFEELRGVDFDLSLTGFDAGELAALMGEYEDGEYDDEQPDNGSLSDRFMVPPFSVLNAREGWWQDRKRAWIALGIKSELGRGGGNDRDFSELQKSGQVARISAAPGGSARPACDYSKKQRGDGAGRPIR
jgi:hypothetical protein